jgi:hypothetical protein
MTDEMLELPFLPSEAGCTKVWWMVMLGDYLLVSN